ncbi:hypothetical protein, partial [Mycobacterium sp. 1465703.0]|uniref:hypothetical protein n=1 Tax=Mycobacterium sp. 1465703.0 TaxID=1834078 RepID=UPI001E4FC96F
PPAARCQLHLRRQSPATHRTLRACARRTKAPLYLGVALTVAVVLFAIVGFWAPGLFVTKELAVTW